MRLVLQHRREVLDRLGGSVGLHQQVGEVEPRLPVVGPELEEATIRRLRAREVAAAYPTFDEALDAFMQHCSQRIGDAYFRTPRNTIREFIHLLAVLEQNADTAWTDLIPKITVEDERNPDFDPLPEDAEDGEQPERSLTDQAPATESDKTSKEADSGDDELASFRF